MSISLFSFLRHPVCASAALTTGLMVLPAPASARLVVCSTAPAPVLAAVARWEGRRFVARGWSSVAPGACRTLIRRQLPRRGKYYVSVRSAKRVIVRSAAGGGRMILCLPRQGRFAVGASQSKATTCRQGWRVYRFGRHRPRSGRIRVVVRPAK